MTSLLEFLSLAITLSDEEIRKIISEQMSPTAMLGRAVTDYWLAFCFSIWAVVGTILKNRPGNRMNRPGPTVDWTSLPFFSWGIVAVWPTTLNYLAHQIFFSIHLLTAATALAILVFFAAVAAWFGRPTDNVDSPTPARWRAVIVPIVIASVFIDLLFYAVVRTPF